MNKYIHRHHKAATLYPLVCFHVGSYQCDMRFITQHLARIKDDPSAVWVYMGDGGECVTKLSKGDVYGQVLPPQQQMECLIDLLSPIAGKGWFGIQGNHGHRIYKETGLDFDQNLMTALRLPYLGTAAMANLVVGRSSYDLYFHHGIDSGTSIRAKVSKAEEFARFVDADAIFTAHSHVAMQIPLPPLLSADNVQQQVRTKMRTGYICGCAYDSRTGYAEDKGYPPLTPALLSVKFDGRVIRGRAQLGQECVVYRSQCDYELTHEYAAEYLGRGIHG